MTSKHVIDTNLYSRQIGAFGLETMGKLVQMKVLIVGLRGVGVEVAKNLILAGPQSVVLCDDHPAHITDLGCNFYLTEAHVARGISRAAASQGRLAELNDYVKVQAASWPSSPDAVKAFLSNFHVVVVTESVLVAGMLGVARHCRQHNIGFILAENRGLAARVVVDYGDHFVCTDANGEECKNSVVAGISVVSESPDETHLNVFTHSDKRHPFQEGDFCVFREVRGLTSLNGTDRPKPVVRVTGPYSFVIKDEQLPEFRRRGEVYDREGVVSQIKVPFEIKFPDIVHVLNPQVTDPTSLNLPTPDLAKFGRSEQLHVAFLAMDKFRTEHGKLPDTASAAEVVRMAQTMNAEIETEIVLSVASVADTEFAPMTSFLGGVVAQEIVKFTGKFHPLTQPLYFDMFEMFKLRTSEAGPMDRYSHLRRLVGDAAVRQLQEARVFLVGAGALGCEFLKAFALLGVGCEGKVVVTDMDRIEVSNLNRQFLFRKEHVGKQKSVCAGEAAVAMNGGLNVEAMEVRVGGDTEDVFDDVFWTSQTVVVNALDNIQARLYVDSRCVWYGKPLLESGTLGTKANVQVVLPGKTQSYGDSQDPPEESIPLCTLKHFPHAIEHTIEWSRDVFQGLFNDAVREAANFATDVDTYVHKIVNEGNASAQKTKLEKIDHLLSLAVTGCSDQKSLVRECVQFAADEFSEKFDHQIQQLLFTFPLDHKNADGQPFWSGPKRAPQTVKLDLTDGLHVHFVQSATNLLLSALGKDEWQLQTEESVRQVLLHSGVAINRVFAPKANVRIKSDDSQTGVVEGAADDEEQLRTLANRLKTKWTSLHGTGVSCLSPVEFEKDDDSNFHVVFMHACANLRARNYSIPECELHRTKMIAGKIIPAVATTTAMVVGLVAAELVKVILTSNDQSTRDIELFKNAFVNLGLPLWILSEPLPPAKTVSKDYDPVSMGPVRAKPEGFTPWDKVEADLQGGEPTLQGLVNFVQNDLKLDVAIISAGNACLYNAFMASHKQRLPKKIRDLYEEVNKKPIPHGKKYLAIEVSATDADDGADVTIPTIKLRLA